MKLRIFTGVLLLALLLAGATSYAAQAGAARTEQFRALMQKTLEAWETLDPATAAPFYATEPDRVFYDILPLKYTGWAEYNQGVKQVLAGFASLKFALGPDVQVAQSGNWAWATATFRADANMKDGTRATFDGRWTVVWVKRGKNWLIAHEHVSVPMAAPEDRSKMSLYKRLGGYDAIAAVVDDFIGRLAKDAEVGRFFAGHSTASLQRVRQLVVDQLCAATGGPCVYTGRDMKTSHAGMGITEQNWQRAVEHLVATLDKFKVPPKEKNEVLTALGGLKRDIVTGR